VTTPIHVLFQQLGGVEHVGACQTWVLLAGLAGPTESTDLQNSCEMIQKATIISGYAQHQEVDDTGTTVNDLLFAQTC